MKDGVPAIVGFVSCGSVPKIAGPVPDSSVIAPARSAEVPAKLPPSGIVPSAFSVIVLLTASPVGLSAVLTVQVLAPCAEGSFRRTMPPVVVAAGQLTVFPLAVQADEFVWPAVVSL